MKNIFFTLVFLVTPPTFAISDFDRAVLFGANAYSMGTFIAQMEGEIARIKLNYEKKTAEFQQNLEKDYQAYLKECLRTEIEYLKNQHAEYTRLYSSLQVRNLGFSKIVDIATAAYKGLLSKESLLDELQRLNEDYPDAEWTEILRKADSFELVLSQAIRLYADSKAVEGDIEEQISFAIARITNAERQLKDLP